MQEQKDRLIQQFRKKVGDRDDSRAEDRQEQNAWLIQQLREKVRDRDDSGQRTCRSRKIDSSSSSGRRWETRVTGGHRTGI